jgi:hypothetical protein
MRQLGFKRWAAAAIGVCVLVAPLAVTAISAPAGASVGVDVIQYVQTTGSSGSYINYVPGDGSAQTSQAITSGGGCATPSPQGVPILSFSALIYSNPVGGVPYTGSPSAAIVGAYKGRTGVCSITPAWSIDQPESLTFAVGTNSLVNGRLLTEANLQLQRTDKANDASINVRLIERNGLTQVGSQTTTLTGISGSTWTVDTGFVSVGFNSVEIQVTSASGGAGISVVGPTSTFSFSKLNQTIQFTNTPPSSPTVGTTYTVTATATSGLAVAFSVDPSSTSGCTVGAASGLVTLSAPKGTCVIDANQPGNARFSPALQVQQSVTSVQLAQSITFTNTPPSSPSVNDTYTVSAVASSTLPVTFTVDASSSAGCTVGASSGLVNLTGPAGTCTIDANQPGNTLFAPAPQVQQSVSVAKLTQSITFTSTPPTNPVINDTYQAQAVSSSGLAVTYSVDPSSTSGCTVDATTGLVTFSAPGGSCLIDATQTGNGSYQPGSAQQSVTVLNLLCGQQTITAVSTDGTAQSGQITATLTFKDYNGQPAPTTVCKPYRSFTATTNDPIPSIGGVQTVDFDSTPLPTAHVVATISWAYQGYCTPDGSNNTVKCAPTFVSLDGGQTWQPQVYCVSAQAAGLRWCTTSKSYSYANGGTKVVENWDGYGDPLFHNGTS